MKLAVAMALVAVAVATLLSNSPGGGPTQLTRDEVRAASAILSAAFGDAGLTIRIEPSRERGGNTFVVAAWTQGFPLSGEPDFGHSLLQLFDTVQQEVGEDQLWGCPLPPCGAHPGHPANAALRPGGLELYCPQDRDGWTRLIPIADV